MLMTVDELERSLEELDAEYEKRMTITNAKRRYLAALILFWRRTARDVTP
jgi:hypothetical protein